MGLEGSISVLKLVKTSGPAVQVTLTRVPHDGIDDTDLEHARRQAQAFAAALTSINPKDRPLTEDAMRMPFFTILNDMLRRRQTKTCFLCELSGDDSAHLEGIECSEGHFHCRKCLVSLAQNFLVV